jgi:hypothetical protein
VSSTSSATARLDQVGSDPDNASAVRVARTVRIIGAMCLLGVALGALASGPAMPAWILSVGLRGNLTADDTVRWIAAGLVTLAVMTLLSRQLAGLALFLGGAGLSFAGIATISGALSARAAEPQSFLPGIVIGVIALAAGVLTLMVLAPRARHVGGHRRGPSLAWPILGGMAVLAASLAGMPSVPMRTTKPLISVSSFHTPRATSEMVSFEFERWEGLPLAATGLDQYLPELPSLIDRIAPDGRVFLVFYNPRCSHCHELFREHFAGDLAIPVIAIEIPPPPDATLVESDEPTEIECPECQRLMLPPTKTWGLTPPAVVRIESGIITCASESNALSPRDCVAR